MPPDKPKAKHGGARPGAGRKPKPPAISPEHLVESAEQRGAANLGDVLSALERNAKGAQSVTETWALAGTLTTGTGPDKQPLFPNLPPDQMVLVARKVTKPKPDTRAASYLADRALGRPRDNDTVKVEEIVSAELQLFIEKVRSRFEPDVAQEIFRALTAPDGAPRAPLVLAPRSGDGLPSLPAPAATPPDDEPFRLS